MAGLEAHYSVNDIEAQILAAKSTASIYHPTIVSLRHC